MGRAILLLCCLLVVLDAASLGAREWGGKREEDSMQVTSSAFEPNGLIPKKYTCDGEDLSPPLRWSDPPSGTQSFALLSDDPDAPVGTWVHWVLYDLPAGTRELTEGLPAAKALPDDAKQGMTDFGRVGYGGPCPPPGPFHRYFFKLYALDTRLNLPPGQTKRQLLKAMEGHALAQGELIGRYKR